MLRLNTLLREVEVEPESFQLVRHQDTRAGRARTPYSAWRSDPTSFEHYQSLQGRKVFDAPGNLASFVVTPRGETLFAGLFRVDRVALTTTDIVCPVSGQCYAPGSHFYYDIVRRPELAELEGRMVIEWGEGTRAWVQRAGKQNKSIAEIRRQLAEPPFPGFRLLRLSTDDVWTMPASWEAVLTAVGGVYLLVSSIDGAQYVGSATGAEGFLSRWRAYADDGHGGNKLLRERGKPPYHIVVLETASHTSSHDDVLALESIWKDKLGSRAYGLNAN
jgi:hypothetical protein